MDTQKSVCLLRFGLGCNSTPRPAWLQPYYMSKQQVHNRPATNMSETHVHAQSDLRMPPRSPWGCPCIQRSRWGRGCTPRQSGPAAARCTAHPEWPPGVDESRARRRGSGNCGPLQHMATGLRHLRHMPVKGTPPAIQRLVYSVSDSSTRISKPPLAHLHRALRLAHRAGAVVAVLGQRVGGHLVGGLCHCVRLSHRQKWRAVESKSKHTHRVGSGWRSFGGRPQSLYMPVPTGQVGGGRHVQGCGCKQGKQQVGGNLVGSLSHCVRLGVIRTEMEGLQS